MGRTLDTLRSQETKRPAPSEEPSPAELVVDWTLHEEVPFIEVGGPGKGVEVSPHLVQHPPQPPVQPPHPPLGKGLGSRPTPVVNLTEAGPMTVAFEAWPGPAVPAGVVPEVITFHQPEHAVSREYAALCEQMLQGVPGAGAHVILLCGLRPRAGTSTVLLNLAVVAARQNRRVAVIDVNRFRPGLAARLGQPSPTGLPDVIAGRAAVSQSLVPMAVTGLHLLPGGKASEPLSAEAMIWLVAWLRERYDVVLLDGPCVTDLADLAALAPDADGTYLVLPHGEEDALDRGTVKEIARLGGRLRGLIHTHFE